MWTTTWPCSQDEAILDQLKDSLTALLLEYYGDDRGKVLTVATGFDGSIPSSDLPVLILFPSEGSITTYQDSYVYEILVYHSVWNSGVRYEHLSDAINLRQFLARKLAAMASDTMTFISLQDGLEYTAVVAEEYSGTMYHQFVIRVPIVENLAVVDYAYTVDGVSIGGELPLQ